MKIIFGHTDVVNFINDAKKGMDEVHLQNTPEDGHLNCGHFLFSIVGDEVHIEPLKAFQGGCLVAPLETFVEYLHSEKRWGLDFSNFIYMEGADECTYLKDWYLEGKARHEAAELSARSNPLTEDFLDLLKNKLLESIQQKTGMSAAKVYIHRLPL